jgi:ABC-type transport system involved in multi-copper enzyme maturation permease subunit
MFVPAPEKGYGPRMLSMREVGLVAEREVLRNLRSTKGIAMFALFFLGGLVPAVVRVMLRKMAGDVPDEVVKATFESYLAKSHGEAIVKHLADIPPIIYFLFEGTLMFLPLLVLAVGFDQIAGEIQHRTIRYSAGRATRASIVTGKALGIWGVVAVMITVLHLTVWIVTLIQGGQPAGAVFVWGGRLLAYSIICAGAYVGFTSLMSSIFKTPIVALFVGAGVGFAIWLLNGILGIFEATQRLTWVFPNRYEKLLYEPDPLLVVAGIGLFLLWGGLCVTGASAIVARRDI